MHPLGPNYINTVYKTAKFNAPKGGRNSKLPAKQQKGEESFDPLSRPSTQSSTPKSSKNEDDGFFDPLSSAGRGKKSAKAPQKKGIMDDDDNKLDDPFANPLAKSMEEKDKKNDKVKSMDISPDKSKKTGATTTASSKEEKKDEEKDFDEEQVHVEEMDTVASTNVWEDEMRGTFLKIFKTKKLEHLKIRNVSVWGGRGGFIGMD